MKPISVTTFQLKCRGSPLSMISDLLVFLFSYISLPYFHFPQLFHHNRLHFSFFCYPTSIFFLLRLSPSFFLNHRHTDNLHSYAGNILRCAKLKKVGTLLYINNFHYNSIPHWARASSLSSSLSIKISSFVSHLLVNPIISCSILLFSVILNTVLPTLNSNNHVILLTLNNHVILLTLIIMLHS